MDLMSNYTNFTAMIDTDDQRSGRAQVIVFKIEEKYTKYKLENCKFFVQT